MSDELRRIHQALGAADGRVAVQAAAVADAITPRLTSIARTLDSVPGAARSAALTESAILVAPHVITNAATAMLAAIRSARKAITWLLPAPTSSTRGHLRPLTPGGDPLPPAESEYVAAPLRMPDTIGITTATQNPSIGTCYLTLGLNLFFLQCSSFVNSRLARQEGDRVIIKVAAGTYSTPATLPVDPRTGEPQHGTSPDGSNLAAYIEKVAAAHFGSYADLRAGNAGTFLTWLAGPTLPPARSANARDLTDDDLYDIISDGYPVGIGTPNTFGYPGDAPAQLSYERELVTGHVYAARSLRPVANELLNPWGQFHPKAISLEDLRTLDMSVMWFELRPQAEWGMPR